jgi:hypothetical protein
MSNTNEGWNFEEATKPVKGAHFEVAGPVGEPKPLPREDFQLEPGKGNLGGPGNVIANAGVGAELPEEELGR